MTLIAWKRRLLRASGTNPSRRLRRLFRGAKVKFRETGDKSLYDTIRKDPEMTCEIRSVFSDVPTQDTPGSVEEQTNPPVQLPGSSHGSKNSREGQDEPAVKA